LFEGAVGDCGQELAQHDRSSGAVGVRRNYLFNEHYSPNTLNILN